MKSIFKIFRLSRSAFTALSLSSIVCLASASACPRINGLLDANCDGKVQIAIFGDSIVRGIKDTGIDASTGGYLRFLEKMFPKVTFVNGGIPGVDSKTLFRAFIKNAPKQGKTYEALQGSDLVMIGVGINDYWSRVPAQTTIRNIQRTQSYVKKFSKQEFGVAPFTMTIAVTNTLRAFQQPWVAGLNQLIFANSAKLGPIVPFNKLAAELVVSEDALHPDDLGYMRLADIVAAALRGRYNQLAKSRNIDKDKDSVADWAEFAIYGTDPLKKDTDEDSLSDGLEIFKYSTNPLLVDSDADGVDDATEISLGTDPNPVLTPTPAATPTETETLTPII
jgi:lysophospholipase L1-like esterase